MGGIDLRISKSLLAIIFLSFSILSVACSKQSIETISISKKNNSNYLTTFNDLGLGILYDFDFNLPNADKRWVTLWVERYNEGKMEDQPLGELSYGLSPNKNEKGSLGLGIINPHSDNTLAFLYAPGVTQRPMKLEPGINTNLPSIWHYALVDEKVELNLNETYLLGVYRVISSNHIRPIDYQDENALQQMINDDNMVLLLKIRVEEKN